MQAIQEIYYQIDKPDSEIEVSADNEIVKLFKDFAASEAAKDKPELIRHCQLEIDLQNFQITDNELHPIFTGTTAGGEYFKYPSLKNYTTEDLAYIVTRDYRGAHKETFLRRLFDIYAEVYKTDPSVIISIADFVKQVGKRYLRDEMNDIDRFLDKTGTHGLVVRHLFKDLQEDNDWEIGGLITPELYDYILFEYELGEYSPQSPRNFWIGMRYKQKDKTDIDFYKLCDDVVVGEFERQEKSSEFNNYHQAEIKRRKNDIAVIGSLTKFKQGIRKYFKSFGKKSLSEEDLMIDTDFRAIRINADSYFIFNYLLHDAPRQNNVIYESKCLKHLDKPEFFDFFRANQILKYSFQDEEGKEILLSLLKTFYYEYLKKANFINCIEIRNDRYFHRTLPISAKLIFSCSIATKL